jgi:tetratricopeptide (TPR) repeat protein
MTRIAASAGVAALALSLSAAPAAAQHQHGSEGIGKVHFDTTCKPEVTASFDRAVALLHSFEFGSAIAGFNTVLQTDPSCAMAYWGIALSSWSNPFAGLKSPAFLVAGRDAARKAQSTGSPSPREKAYIDAVAELYRDLESVPQRTRTLAYEKAMEKASGDFPADTEARIFYALALAQNALPTDKTYANQLKATAILEPLFRQYPDHPGLAHYIIHAYDQPALAARALDAARSYSKIAPDAPHALHMPSHTFTRVGAWADSIATNNASAESAMKLGCYAEVLHAMDYQAYAYLQTAQDASARRVVDRLPAIARVFDPAAICGAAPGSAGLFALAVIPARYALERGDWAAAAALDPRPTPFAWVDAQARFARALGAARAGSAEAARADIEQLTALRDKLTAGNDTYWAGQVDIQRRVAEAWVAYASGRREEAIAQLTVAADAEDATDKSVVTPGPLAPARELLGDMLLDSGHAADALRAYEATIVKEPNRFRAVYGAGRAAAAAGNRERAAQYYRQLIQICKSSDTERAELKEARAFATNR